MKYLGTSIINKTCDNHKFFSFPDSFERTWKKCFKLGAPNGSTQDFWELGSKFFGRDVARTSLLNHISIHFGMECFRRP